MQFLLKSRLFHSPVSNFRHFSSRSRSTPPAKSGGGYGEDEWNDAWETAWLPDDLSARERAPWETDVNFPSSSSSSVDIDADTKAFVADMDDRWTERRSAKKQQQQQQQHQQQEEGKDRKDMLGDYRTKKQRLHSGLWMKEIEKMEESKLGGSNDADHIDRLLDSCAEIFDAGNIDLNDSKNSSTHEFKTKPDGWETTTKTTQDGSIWDISQREEDILLQEFERRMAFNKFQIASFIKTHIFSRRRPIDGWKYMIEVIGPNAKRGKGSVQRLPGLTDSSTQPFQEEKPAIGPNSTYFRNR